jgi:hypothetical protein
MPDRNAPDRLDTELRRIAHALVAEAPAAPESPPAAAVAVRLHGRPRRRYVLAVAAVAVVGISLAGALLLTTVWQTDDADVKVGHQPTATGPQRLILEGWPGEVLPNGSLVELPLGGLDRLGLSGPPQPLPGRRHVLLGVRDVTPEVPVDEDAGFEGDPAFFLVVVDADGNVELEREVEVTDEYVSLIAATPTEAILSRIPREDGDQSLAPGRIVAFDLETGRERLLAEPDIEASRADVVGDRLVVGEGVPGDLDPNDSCGLEVIDLANGDRTRQPSPAGCSEVLGVRASPSGDTAAVIYGVYSVGEDPEIRLAIVDLADSTIRRDELLGHNVICPPTECPRLRPVHYLGAAWDNDTTLRVALFDLATNPVWDGVEPVTKDELLIETRTVEGSSLDAGEPADPDANDAAVPRVWAREPASTDEGLAAEVRGSLTYDATQGCFLLELEGIQYPVVWPAGTVGTSDGPGVVLRDGSTLHVGDGVSGGGGYLQVAGEYGIPPGCLPSTGEVAVFNPNASLRPGGR